MKSTREPETHQNARPFGSSMADRQRFGCPDTWPCNCKQKPSFRFPIVNATNTLWRICPTTVSLLLKSEPIDINQKFKFLVEDIDV